MPFTPLHMGPALLVKAPLKDRFSLVVFGWTQIVMDIQPLVAMTTGQGPLHGWTHTVWGALLLGLAAALSGKYAAETGLRRFFPGSDWRIRWPVAFASAWLGSFSHVLLDSIMHADMRPMAPFSEENALLQALSLSQLHWLCLLTGLVGSVIYLWLNPEWRISIRKDRHRPQGSPD